MSENNLILEDIGDLFQDLSSDEQNTITGGGYPGGGCSGGGYPGYPYGDYPGGGCPGGDCHKGSSYKRRYK